MKKDRDYITAGAYYRLMKDMLIEAIDGISKALNLNKKQQREFCKVWEHWRALDGKLGLENMAANDTNFNGRVVDIFYGRTIRNNDIISSDTDKQILSKANEILMSLIDNSAEREEKPNGEWITKIFPNDESPLFRNRYYCSVCGEWQTYGKPKFCMNCGSRMKGGEADDTV